MISITIGPVNSRIQGDVKTLVKLKNFLSFKHPDARFIRESLKYSWDGMVYPMNDKGILNTGLLPKALDFMVKHYEDFEDKVTVIDHRAPYEVGDIPNKIGEFVLYPHQRQALQAVASNSLYGIPWPQGFISAGMGAGKTLIMFGLYLTFKKPKTIIVVDNSKLYEQHKKDLRTIFPEEYGYLRGKREDKEGNIKLCMVKTLVNRLKDDPDFLQDVRMVLVDEADLAGSKSYKIVLGALEFASIRIGLSGTIFNRDLKKDILRNNTLRSRFGEILYEIPTSDLEDIGIISKATVKLIPGISGVPGATFKEEFDNTIGNNKNHYQLIAKRVKFNLLTHKYPIMVFTRYIKQTEMLGEFLKETFPSIPIAYVHHKSIEDVILQDFNKGDIKVLVCSLFLKRGLSFPLVRCIINASAGEFYSNPLQILGRGTRTGGGKKMKFYFEDIMDTGKYLERHSKQRHLHYKREGYYIRDLRI